VKITDVQAIQLEYEKDFPKLLRSFALIRIKTDSGIVGYGEASSSYGHFYPSIVAAIIDEVIGRILNGEDPLNLDRLLFKMHHYLDGYLGSEGITAQVISGVEIALWDIIGKATGQPVCRLLGGYREGVPLYGTGTTYFEQTPEWHCHFFDAAIAHGFKGVKARIGNNPQADLRLVQTVREYLPPEMHLMVDAFWSYSPDSAIRLTKELGRMNIYFFEEPLPQYEIEGLAKLKAASPVRIAVGERVYSLRGFKEVVVHHAADVLQPDATICGGILEAKKVFALGEAFDVQVLPHIGGLSAVGIAANLHLAASVSACDLLEYDLSPTQPLRDELLKDPIFSMDRIRDGLLPVPDKPGLGIEIDESVFDKYPYKGGQVYPDVYKSLGAGRL
jgi:L-alanine-DL-glutamate epimerase-like enolase superfamily enzyme